MMNSESESGRTGLGGPMTDEAAAGRLQHVLQSGLDELCAVTVQDELDTAQPGDKVFPATYLEGEVATYATEKVGEGKEERTVYLLDSIPSQARRLATALHELDQPKLPRLVLVTDAGVPIYGTDRQPVSTMTANHRLYDMVFQSGRYPTTGSTGQAQGEPKTYFAESEFGRTLLNANQADASLVFKFCPTVLLFGGWNSRLSSWGTKFRRAVTSRIVAHEQSSGRRTASRVDILGIEHVGTVEYEKKAPHRWKLLSKEQEEARATEGVERQKLSKIGLGFIPPSVEPLGGIYPSRILHTFVLNVAELRHLRFGALAKGVDDGSTEAKAESATTRNQHARSILAAVGLLAYALQVKAGYNLRSGCLLRRKHAAIHIVLRGHSPEKDVTIDFADVDQLLKSLITLYESLTTSNVLSEVGLAWSDGFPEVLIGDELSKVLELSGIDLNAGTTSRS